MSPWCSNWGMDRGLLTMDGWAPPSVSDRVDPGRGPRCCISNKLPRDVDAAGLGTTVQKPEQGIWTLAEEPTGGKSSRDRDIGDCRRGWGSDC